MSEVGARMARDAQLALIAGAVRLARLDPETEEHAGLLGEITGMMAHMAFEPALIGGGAVSRLRFKIADYAAALETLARDATGELDWRRVGQAKETLRREAEDCLEALYRQCRARWGGAALAAVVGA